jgi:hypothetical protein
MMGRLWRKDPETGRDVQIKSTPESFPPTLSSDVFSTILFPQTDWVNSADIVSSKM